MDIIIPTVDDIHEQLLGLPPDDIGGTCNDANSCLVARAMERLNPRLAFEVGWGMNAGDWEAHDESYHRVAKGELPPELNVLARRFDRLRPDAAGDTEEADMTAAEILERWNELVPASGDQHGVG